MTVTAHQSACPSWAEENAAWYATHVADQAHREALVALIADALDLIRGVEIGLRRAAEAQHLRVRPAVSDASLNLAASALSDLTAQINRQDLFETDGDAQWRAKYRHDRDLVDCTEPHFVLTAAQLDDRHLTDYIRGYRAHLTDGPRP